MIDVVPDGQTPQTVTLCQYDELVDFAKPGDRFVVVLIFPCLWQLLTGFEKSRSHWYL